MTKDKNIKEEKKANTNKKTKRKKINLVNILLILLAFSLLFSFVFKNKESLKNILTKTNKQKADQTYTGKDLKIGDIVYYNHEITKPEGKDEFIPVDDKDLTVTYDKGSAETPGTGEEGTKTFTAKDKKVLWKVWDINKTTGEVTLVSDKYYTLANSKAAIGYIWYEYNMHKGASTFGHGYGANKNTSFTNLTSRNKNFTYKVGSGLENTGDTAHWKIGEEPDGIEKIKKSGTRALTLGDIEEKLGITDEKIKKGENGIDHTSGVGYGNIAKLNINFPQRKVKGLNQKWDDEKIAKAAKQDVEAKNGNYSWTWENVPEQTQPYKDLIKRNSDYTPATTTLDSDSFDVDFHRASVRSGYLYSIGNLFVKANSIGGWSEYSNTASVRFLAFLEPNLKYYKDPDPNKTNEWDIIKPKVENKKVEIGNYQNIDFEPKINLVQNAVKTPLTKENNKYVKNIEVKSGIERQDSGYAAKFVELTPNTKYTIEVENLPSGYTFEIEGKTNKEIDIKDKTSYTLIFKKDNKEIATRPANSSELNIGDVVYYNHKITKKEKTHPEDIDEYVPVEDKDLTVTYDKGNAETPGTGEDGTKTFSSKGKKALWKVWDINKTTGEVTLISDNTFSLPNSYGAIGYIWYEYNMHKGASTFGHGYGANKNTSFTNSTSRDQNFTYKVGSGLENTGDTARWKIGEEPGDIEKIKKSGTRALTLGDIEEKLGITDEKIKKGENGIHHISGVGYGNIAKLNINFPQRKVKGLNQNWADETNAKAAKQDVEAKNGYYYWIWEDVPEETQPYKDLIKTDSYDYTTATTTLNSDSAYVDFDRAYVNSDYLHSAYYFFVSAYGNGTWGEASLSLCPRLATFLESGLSYFKAPGEDNAWDILKVNSQPKDLEIKTTNLTKTDEKIKINLSSELNGKDIIKNPEIKEINVLANKSDSQNVTVPIYSGQIRKGKLIDAEYTLVHNKYKVEITGLPANSTYKIIGADKNGYIDLAKVSSIEAIIYPKAGDYKVPIEYSGGENDNTFSVSGKLKLMNGNTIVKSQTVELKKGVSNITFADVDMFNNTTNKLNEYTVVFEKTKGRHKVEINSGKVIVTYVPEEMEINISAKSDGPITLDNIVVNLVKTIGENITKEEITLENASRFTKKITVPKTDDSGNKITYSIEKKSLNMGYITTISGYDVNLKAVLALPFTGSSANLKVLVVILGISTLIGIVFRHRKKMNYIPNGIIK